MRDCDAKRKAKNYTFAMLGSSRFFEPSTALLALACILFTGVLLLTPETAQQLRYDRLALAQGEWWRLISGQWVHLNTAHWIANSLALLVLPGLFADMRAGTFAWCALGAALAVGLGL